MQGQPSWEQIQHVSLQMANMYDFGGPVHYQQLPVSPADFRTPLAPRQAEMLLNQQQRHWQSGEEFVACAPVPQTGPPVPGQGLLQNPQEQRLHGRYIVGSTVAVSGNQDPGKGSAMPHGTRQTGWQFELDQNSNTLGELPGAGANLGRWYDGTSLSQQMEVLSLNVIQPGEPLKA